MSDESEKLANEALQIASQAEVLAEEVKSQEAAPAVEEVAVQPEELLLAPTVDDAEVVPIKNTDYIVPTKSFAR